MKKMLLFICLALVIAYVGLKLLFPLPDENFASPTTHQGPDWEGPLGRAVAPALALHDGLNGFRPLADGRAAFAARAILIREANTSIDAQYYIWQDDTTGLMLLEELRAAAERGVRVRLLLDDNGIPGLDGLVAELNALPTAQVRIFNPFTLRRPKLLSYLFDFRRLNRRMHNKSLTVDGIATVVGGRNIGDIYFAYGEGTHYFDVDTIAVGPIVEDVSDAFDAYWNSGSAYAAERVIGEDVPDDPQIASLAATARDSETGRDYQKAVHDTDLAQRIAARDLPFEWGAATLFVDDPIKGLGLATDEQIIVDKLIAAAEESERSLDLVSAYFIPGENGTEVLTRLAISGVAVRVLTNALDATDVLPVHSAYARYRGRLVDGGVDVYELRAMREDRPERSLPEYLAGSASGLHAKVFSFDRKRIFIGSYNLDPRSARLNTEMGLMIDCPGIANTFSDTLDNSGFAYRVDRDDNGRLEWIERNASGAVVARYSKDPHVGIVKRALVMIIGWLPIEWIL